MKNPNSKIKYKNIYSPTALLLVFLVFSVYYLETILRISSTGMFLAPSLFFSFIFGIIISLIIFIISLLFPKYLQGLPLVIMLSFLTLLFISQSLYYQVFKTFYTVYSVGNASQILEFYQDIIIAIKNNFVNILLLFIPLFSLIFLQKYLVGYYRLKLKLSFLLVFITISFYFIGIFSLKINADYTTSPYNLYYKIHSPQASVNNLGLLTYMRLNFQRLLTNWSEQLIEEPNPQDPEEDSIIEEPIEYNTLEIDFDALIENENNEVLLKMHNYFSDLKPTEKNEFTGIYKDYNLIVLTAEAFSHLAVHPDITPTLYKLVHEGYYFTNFYTPLWDVSTSDGEYVANVGLLPKSEVWSFYQSSNNYLPFALGNQLKKIGYSTRAYHNHTYTYYYRHLSHPNLGYFYQGVGNGLNVRETWPESDLEMMELTVPKYINDEPFHTYYMTVSGHLGYNYNGNSMATKNKKYVQDLDLSEAAQAYLACQIELDKALEYLLKQLETAGIADHTLIALSADHYPYGLKLKEMEELAGHKIDTDFELYRNAFILYTPNMEPVQINKLASSLDIIPTLSNLLGLPYDSRLLMGKDIFSNSEPLVIFEDRSFITERGKYNATSNTFTWNPGFEKDDYYITTIKNEVNSKFYYSTKILERDYYGKILR